jgi:uncharacterized membrane protein
MSLAQGAALSADATTHALAVCFFAVALRSILSDETPLARGEALRLVALALLLGLAKPGYWPLAAVVLVIPAQRFRGGLPRAAVCTAVVGAALLASLAWLLWARSGQPLAPSPGCDPEAQLRFVSSHPFGFLATVGRTLADAPLERTRSFVGILGHLNVPLPGLVYAVWPLALVAAALLDGPDPPALSRGRRFGLVAVFLLGALSVMGMAYLGWNAVGAELIMGVQGRYFAPLLPLLLLALPPLRRSPPAAWLVGATATVALLSLSAALDALWSAFYGS